MADETALSIAEQAIKKLESTSLASGSLGDLAKRKTRRSMLLIDCSGSMDMHIKSGQRKIDALREVVRDLRSKHDVPMVAFGVYHEGRSGVMVVDEIPEPDGTTPMAAAIRFANTEGATHAVIVTDGCPDSEHEALFEGGEFKPGIIDVFYIGDGNDRGAAFAEKLAKLCGGSVNLTDLMEDPKQLSSKIAGLLGEGTKELNSGPINLGDGS